MSLAQKSIGIIVAAIIFVADRVLKEMTNYGLLHGAIGPLQFIPLHNPGAMGGRFPHQHLLLAIIGIVIMLVMAIVWIRHRVGKFELLFQVGWGLLFGGAFGNTFDRVVYGYVTDMFHLPHGHGIFNLSDISLQVGVVCLILSIAIQPKRKQG